MWRDKMWLRSNRIVVIMGTSSPEIHGAVDYDKRRTRCGSGVTYSCDNGNQLSGNTRSSRL